MNMKKSNLKPPSLLTQTERLLRKHSLHARKGLGQHFLIDEEVLQKTVSAAELSPNDIIIEIGPGMGILTRELAKHAGRVITVEMDSKLTDILKHDLASFDNITTINADILQIEPSALLQETRAGFPSTNSASYKVVANLPYYIASPVLRQFLEATAKPQSMVVMVQKEVAETIVAKPGRTSLQSVSVQFYGEPKIISYVPAKCFYPPPKVDSAILHIKLYPQPAVDVDEKSFFELVRAGFSAPRKQIVNSLARGLELSKTKVLLLLEKADILPQRRAQTLTLNEWAHLWSVLAGTENRHDNR